MGNETQNLQDYRFYYVVVDRFSNGDSSNDRGGSESKDPLIHGFLPSHKGYYHGGDLKGVINKLKSGYFTNLGVNALWLSPIMKNKPVQRIVTKDEFPKNSSKKVSSSEESKKSEYDKASAGYHGYWITDFTKVDPHIGTEKDLKELVAEAHKRGIKVFFDIITNHTADVIKYKEPFNKFHDQFGWGHEFKIEGYTPIIPKGEEDVKKPDILNYPEYYNNKGNTDFSDGEKGLLGDFYGLDDLDTSNVAILAQMKIIYRNWAQNFNIDGYRIDTIKHVEMDFWKKFIKSFDELVEAKNFFIFGESYDSNPANLSKYTQTFPSVLDFAFQNRASTVFAGNGGAEEFIKLFNSDDYYNGKEGNLVTFLGNHDMGRFFYFLMSKFPNISNEEALARGRAAFAFQAFWRGHPCLYYGDEQGFVGRGGDQDARQNMDKSLVKTYNTQNIGDNKTPQDDNFDQIHPLYQLNKKLFDFRAKNKGFSGWSTKLITEFFIVQSKIKKKNILFAFERHPARSSADSKLFNSYVFLFNLSGKTQKVNVNYSNATPYLIIGNVSSVRDPSSNKIHYSLGPWSCQVFKKQDDIKLGNPSFVSSYFNVPKPNYIISSSAPFEVSFTIEKDGASLENTYFNETVSFYAVVDGKKTFVGRDISPIIEKSSNASVYQGRTIPTIKAKYRIFYRLPSTEIIKDGQEITFEAHINRLGQKQIFQSKEILVDRQTKETIIYYQNGNKRSHIYGLTDQGQPIFPMALENNRFKLVWPKTATKVYLYYYSQELRMDGNVQQKFFYFNDPIELNALEHKRKILFIANNKQISYTEKLLSEESPQRFSPKITNHNLDLYIRGSLNSWGKSPLKINKKADYREAKVTFPKGVTEYKVADGEWKEYNSGGPIEKGWLTKGTNPPNLKLSFDKQTTCDVYLIENRLGKTFPMIVPK